MCLDRLTRKPQPFLSNPSSGFSDMWPCAQLFIYFNMGTREPNTSPLACIASPLLSEPSFQPITLCLVRTFLSTQNAGKALLLFDDASGDPTLDLRRHLLSPTAIALTLLYSEVFLVFPVVSKQSCVSRFQLCPVRAGSVCFVVIHNCVSREEPSTMNGLTTVKMIWTFHQVPIGFQR